MVAQAEAILRAGASAVLVKGGHGHGPDSTDILLHGGGLLRLSMPRVATPNTHGTGCTLSAAIAAGLARKLELAEAVREARAYLQGALEAGAALRIGEGRGPVHHFHRWWPS
jgi:hydroxymethylpyrimidine/phosphomethylpyrimidine kinase